MDCKIVGREREQQRLGRCLTEKQAQLIVVYGRRRVGKTFLIDRFFNGSFDFRFIGVYGQPKDVQLQNFAAELGRQQRSKVEVPKEWSEAFDMLRTYLEGLPKDRKHIVFFDEFPWMDTARSGFLPAFEWFWNGWGSAQSDLVFVVCGSATSWMTKKLDDNKGGLYNRQTCRIYLEPFSLYETEKYLEHRNIHWSRIDICECYMILGGIPYYLSLLDPGISYNDNIDALFFQRRSELWDEFSHLYRTLFTNGDLYIRIAEALSAKRSGMTRLELIKKAGVSNNGVLSTALKDLADSGFVRVESFYGNKKKQTVYQLADYYSLFYFRFIQGSYGEDEHYWRNMHDNSARRVWAALTFEQVCKDHINQIKQKLGISGVQSKQSTWFTGADPEDPDDKGAQIDLIIDRRDRTINVCEVKYAADRFTIDKTYDQELRSKIEVFRRKTGTRKTIQLTMLTTYGVKQNMYSSIVTNQVTLDDLFEEIRDIW